MSASRSRVPVVLAAALLAAQGIESAPPSPAELLKERRIAWRLRPVVSPDGHSVAYTVYDPPQAGAPGDLGEFTPTGVPVSFAGSRLFVTDVESGHTAHVRPDGCSGCTTWSPSWAPDGSRIAFYSDADGGVRLWSYTPANGRTERISDGRIRIKLYSDDNPIWSPDGEELYVLLAPPDVASSGEPASSRGQVAHVYRSGLESLGRNDIPGHAAMEALAQRQRRSLNGSLAAVNALTGRYRVLADAHDEPAPIDIKLSPSGRWIAYLSAPLPKTALDPALLSYSSLLVVSTSGGEKHVVDPDVQPVLTGLEVYSAAYLWRPKSDQLVYQKNRRLLSVDLAGDRRPAPVTPHDTRVAVHRRNHPAFTRDGRHLLFLAEGAPPVLALASMGGEPPRTLAVLGDGDAYDGAILSPGDALWQPDADAMYVAAIDSTGHGRVERVDVVTGGRTTVWRHRGVLEMADLPHQTPEPIGLFEDFNTPKDLYAFGRGFATRRSLARVNPTLDEAPGRYETFTVTVPCYDGSRRPVTTTFIAPAGSQGPPAPSVVIVYPGADFSRYTRTYAGGWPLALPLRVLTWSGYRVLLVETPIPPRGQSAQFARDVTDSVMAQVYEAARRGAVDIDRLALMGHSYGGFATLAVIASTNLFRAAIALSPALVDPVGAWGRMDASGIPFAGWVENRGMMGVPPWADLNRYVTNSPYLQAERIRTPLLLIHGDRDVSFPAQESGKMFAALSRLGRTAQLATYRGQGHAPADWSLESSADAVERIVDFLSRHLGT